MGQVSKVRKQLRDIRIGEMLLTGDRREPWAIVEDVQPFPVPTFGVRGCVRVTLAGPSRIYEMPMRLDGYWDVAA